MDVSRVLPLPDSCTATSEVHRRNDLLDHLVGEGEISPFGVGL
jgi:hypothetical protein